MLPRLFYGAFFVKKFSLEGVNVLGMGSFLRLYFGRHVLHRFIVTSL